MSNKTYDIMKDVTLLYLPALSAMYYGLSAIWNFPAPEKVVGTIAVICTFLGTVLKISSINYKEDEENE